MRIPILILFLFLGFNSRSQTENEILSTELDVYIQEQMEIQSIPSASCCIVKCDQVVYQSSFGYAHIEENQLATVETEYTLASISKLFIATACALLWQEGELDLDANINDYLPIEIINPNHPEMMITTRQLLNHKSSLHDSESDLQLWDEIGDPIYDLPTFCAEYFIEGGDLFVSSNWGLDEPGNTSYWYSNAGFTLLGYIVEEVSQMPFNDYVRIHILEPLQMNSAGWLYSEIDANDVAMPYDNSWNPYGYYSVPEYPAAMLKSNLLELSNFLKMYTQEGHFAGNEILEDETFAMLVPNDFNNGFAWWGQDTWWGDSDGIFWSHGGYMNGVRTQLNYYPADSTGLIILTNGNINYSAIQNELENYISLFECDEITSVSQLDTQEINIYPVPSEDNVNIVFENRGQRSFQLYNSIGHLVDEFKSEEQNVKVSLQPYEGGFYSIKIQDSESTQIKKLIKE